MSCTRRWARIALTSLLALAVGLAVPAATDLRSNAAALPSSPTSQDCGSRYMVQRGDSPLGIANRCGVSFAELGALNDVIRLPGGIRPGMELRLPPRDVTGAQRRLAALEHLQEAGVLPTDDELATLPSEIPTERGAEEASRRWRESRFDLKLGEELFVRLSLEQVRMWLEIYFGDLEVSGLGGEKLVTDLGAIVEFESRRFPQVMGDLGLATPAHGLLQVLRPRGSEDILTSLHAQGEAARIIVRNQGLRAFNVWNNRRETEPYRSMVARYEELGPVLPQDAARLLDPGRPVDEAAPTPDNQERERSEPTSTVAYLVRRGDTAWSLARRCEVTFAELAALNREIPDLGRIIAGVTVLRIPAGCAP